MSNNLTTIADDLADLTLTQARMITALDSDPPPRPGTPRIIISLDATCSMGEYLEERKLTLETARGIVEPLFAQAGADGLEVQLIYFRGDDRFPNKPRECRASKWFRDAEELARTMAAVEHWPGWTQHDRVFKHVIREAEKGPVHGLLLISDAYEAPVASRGGIESARSRALRRAYGDVLENGCKDAMRLRRVGVKITVAYKGTIEHGCPA